jgi:hypothetical protein
MISGVKIERDCRYNLNMAEWFRNEYVRVMVLLIVGLIAIVYFNPLHTPCHSQVDQFDEEIKPLVKPFKKHLDLCKQRTDSGGCLPLFETLGKFEVKLRLLGYQCQAELGGDANASGILSQSMELMVRAAWGAKPPASYVYKNGWLDSHDVALFCKFKNYYERIKGKEAVDAFVNRLLGDLPGSDQVGRTETWNRSILSDSCQYSL